MLNKMHGFASNFCFSFCSTILPAKGDLMVPDSHGLRITENRIHPDHGTMGSNFEDLNI